MTIELPKSGLLRLKSILGPEGPIELAVSCHLASSMPEHPWPSFDGTKLPLSQPARQQLSRVYSDFKNNSKVAQRKSNLLRWIQSSAFDPIKGIHLPVSKIVETNAADALNRSKNLARTPLNFPEMPPVPRFFSNALMVGTESPSLRGTNAGLIIVTHEIDTENLAEFEEVLAWTRGARRLQQKPFCGA